MDQSLIVFSEVADTRNFSRAAERLHMTQPAVSQHIRALEERLKVRLLERNNKSVTLTKAGEIVLHHAKEIGGLYRKMQEMVDELMHYTGGPLSVGASYTFGEYVLPLTLARLHTEFPDIRPAVVIGNTADIAEQVRNRVLDVGIVEGEEIGSGLSVEKLAEDEMYVAAGARHPLANVSPIPLRLLEEQTWLVREQGSGTRAAADKMFAELAIQPSRLMEMGSTQSIKETVEAGLGVTLQSRWALRKELGLGSLKVLNIEGLPFKRSFHVLLRNGDLRTRTMEVFLQTLRSASETMLSSNSTSPEKSS
ncbi:LysR family transcriptional regulator [Cohnella luojiensis]|uniref:LysR family transcriptional regulator n=1 Tax=Cohnella luojiensis TaxID=652876 RepID=A0A4Y8M1T6_9BACL|nr:LysR family transcriptional regulator [Cohnella luojiensis]TFE28929.1 LysR family transcriptional regulator [Cohnella luojiensis]